MTNPGAGRSGGDGSPPDAPPRASWAWIRLLADRGVLRLLEALTKLAEHSSIDRSLAAAAVIGRLWVVVGAPRTRCVSEALDHAFPDAPPEVRHRLRDEVFVHLARGLAELLLLGGRHRQALLERVELIGLDRLAAAARSTAGGGVIVVSAHLGNWELACAKAAALGIPISIVYRERPSSVLARALGALRARAGLEDGGVPLEAIAMGRAGLPVVRALKAGRNVLVMLDQNADRDEGVFVSFFGRPACTRSAPAALAALCGVPIVPAFIHREDGGRRHRLEIQPALALEPGAAADAAVLRRNVQRITSVVEEAIRRDPGQWIWTHRRWRTRPRLGDPIEAPSAGATPDRPSVEGAFAGPRARV